MRRLLVFALLAAALAAVAAMPAAARPRGSNGKIVTNSDNRVTGQEQVYTVDPDGTDLALLMNDAESGQWSPDGKSIAVNGGILDFATGSFHDLSLGTLYPDLFLGCGVWSPDGKRLACEGGFVDPSLQGVYTLRASDGGDLQRLTSVPNGDDCPSDYSPTGKRLVITSSPGDRPPALATIRPGGTGLRLITPLGMEINFCNGSWSPKGNEIVFSAHVPADHHSSIWVVHADGSGLRELPVPGCGGPSSDPTTIGCFSPTWSPDGRKIVFARRQGNGQADLYTVNAGGSGLFQVTNTPDVDEFGGDWGTHRVTR